jgi:hypothetical protein
MQRSAAALRPHVLTLYEVQAPWVLLGVAVAMLERWEGVRLPELPLRGVHTTP